MVRDFGAKLRITAAALGCASQKDLCARFREANPGTIFELDRSYKWMQGRALPRSVGLYEDWAALLGTGRPVAWLQACTVDEFLELLCGRFEVRREALLAQAELDTALEPKATAPEPRDALPGRHLVGVYACYSHAWSPYFEGRIMRSALAIEVAVGAAPALLATYAEERVAFGRVGARGPVTVSGRSVHVDLADPVEFRLAMNLFLPGALASVLAGVMSGISWVDPEPQPAATRIVMIRIPGATAAALEASNRYLDAAEPISADLRALRLSVAEPRELDGLLEGFLSAYRRSGYLKVGAEEHARLAQATDRLFIENARGTGARPLPSRARRSSQGAVRLVRG